MDKQTVIKAMPFSVIFRNGVALKGFAKHGTAMSNCDPSQDDHVVDGMFGWQPCKPARKARKESKGK